MSGEQLLYFGLCVASLLFAAHVPAMQRAPAIASATAILTNWAFGQWTYAPAAPQNLIFYSTGFYLQPYQMWAAVDCAATMVAIIAGRRWWWGWALLWLGMAWQVLHTLRDYGLLSGAPYLAWLDAVLLGHIAVFVVIGEKGMRDAVRVHASVGVRGVVSRRALSKVPQEVTP
jgi:hypothetical protein